MGIGRYLLAPLVPIGRRPHESVDASIHLLISSKTWSCAILCLWSLEVASGVRWTFYVHDDGTVPAAGKRRLLKRFPEAIWISREEADQYASKKLVKYPVCFRQRQQHNYLMKVTDSLLFNDGGPFVILDADIIFYRKPTEICEWAVSSKDKFLYMSDNKEAYCLQRNELKELIGIEPAVLLNAGICCVPENAMDLDFCESVLAKIEKKTMHPMFFDQTLLALVSGKTSSKSLPDTYEISWSFLRKHGAICRHYVGPAKFDLLYMEGPASLLFSKFFREKAVKHDRC